MEFFPAGDFLVHRLIFLSYITTFGRLHLTGVSESTGITILLGHIIPNL